MRIPPRWLILTFCTLLGACASLSQRRGPPRVAEVQDMRGQPRADVLKALGKPSDVQGARVFYYLSEESTYHPEPHGKLYELIFLRDRLSRVESR